MKLKKLELQGYKTFASKTSFEFDAGITAVVGPNGSGKSNVADAIRWVLGEQSYSTLRGKRTTDMIFAGSQERARAGMAQAILTLDNSDGWLPIDYTEVTIGRRAFRSGENEYLINGQQVRLRDVQELLATSGLAERTYTIVGQGLIDQALSLRAEERRALFEEAAGISHYQARRATTLRRLQETERNLERVQDILAEIRPRLGGLKRQANRARTYEQVHADLRHMLRIWYGYQWEEKKKALREQRQQTQAAEKNWKESRERLGAQQDEADALRRQIGRLQRELTEKGEERERLRGRREQARRQVAVLSERQTLLQKQAAEIETELPRLEEEQEQARREMDQALGQLESAQSRLAEQQQTLKQFNQSFKVQQAEIDHWRAAIGERERAHKQAQRRLSQAEGQFSQLEERQQEGEEGPDEAEEAAVAARLQKLAKVLAAAEARVAALTEERQAVQVARQAKKRERKELLREEATLNRQATQLNKEVARLEARCDLLDQMRQKEVTVPAGVEVVGRVAGLVRIPAAHRTALEAALGARLGTLLVRGEADLWQLLTGNGQEETVWAVATEATGGAATKARDEVGENEAIIGWADELVETHSLPAAVVDLLFGPVLLVRNREAAYALAGRLPAGGLAVSPEGIVVYAGGLVKAGQQDARQSILAREEAWRAAQEALEAEKEAAVAAQAAAEGQQAAVARANQQLNEFGREEQRLNRLIQEANQEAAHARRDLDRVEQQQAFLEKQAQAAVRRQKQLQERIATTQAVIAEGEAEVVRLESRVAQARAELADLPVAEAEQQRQNRQQEIETARTIVAGREAVVESRRATLNQIENQLRRQRERQQNLLRQAQQLDLVEAEAALDTLQAQIDGLDKTLAPRRRQLKEKQAELEALADAMSAIQRRTHHLETAYTQTKVALSQQESELEGLIERIRNDLGLVVLEFDEEQAGQTPLPIGEIVDQLPTVSRLPDDIEETIQNYRGQLHRIGSVNPDAPEEYEQTQERYEFLSQQVTDLQQTEKRLRKVIADLDEMTSRAFAATVKEVDGIFGEMFERLFGGGNARLVLTDPDDLTVSGVDIIARLPNRRQQRLALLSGGERSLTAAALLFALLKVSPPPFSALDEVDAMLDEANVTRFRSVLRELAQKTQFIVITHNRGTVQVAKTVYGISMGSDSTSQVISIKPEQYVNQ